MVLGKASSLHILAACAFEDALVEGAPAGTDTITPSGLKQRLGSPKGPGPATRTVFKIVGPSWRLLFVRHGRVPRPGYSLGGEGKCMSKSVRYSGWTALAPGTSMRDNYARLFHLLAEVFLLFFLNKGRPCRDSQKAGDEPLGTL